MAYRLIGVWRWRQEWPVCEPSRDLQEIKTRRGDPESSSHACLSEKLIRGGEYGNAEEIDVWLSYMSPEDRGIFISFICMEDWHSKAPHMLDARVSHCREGRRRRLGSQLLMRGPTHEVDCVAAGRLQGDLNGESISVWVGSGCCDISVYIN